MRALRILSVALISMGLTILADVAITLAWREPISSLYGGLQQGKADDELAELETRYPTASDLEAVRGIGDSARKAAVLARRFRSRLREGGAIGRIRSPGMGLDAVIVQGTETATLQKGPGHYPKTPLPGQGGTVAIAGHRTTYLAPFRDIDRLERGDLVEVEMPYATFAYEVERHRVVGPTNIEVVRRVGHERLVLTACHPLYSNAERYVVFARLVGVNAFPADLSEPWVHP
jgi:sortase A